MILNIENSIIDLNSQKKKNFNSKKNKCLRYIKN